MKSKSAHDSKLRTFRPFATATLLLLSAGVMFGQLQTPNVQASDQIDAVAITITPFGPYPALVQHSASPFVLFIVNRSGVLDDTFSLVIKPSNPSSSATSNQVIGNNGTTTGTPPPNPVPSLLDLHSTQTMQRDHQLIFPLPGNYQLRFQSHPDWIVDIAITQ